MDVILVLGELRRKGLAPMKLLSWPMFGHGGRVLHDKSITVFYVVLHGVSS
jgi:hypothetical protein